MTAVDEDAAPVPDRIGPFRILRRVGEGGMGVVYEAEQDEPRRRVALKVIRGGQVVDDAAVRLFRREVQSLALLQHPGVAALYGSGRTEDGQHWFAMEFVDGEPLDAFLRARAGTRVDAAELRLRLRLFSELCDAVAYAHGRGVIHRDLKPPNVIAVAGAPASAPRVKVLDFGLARITDQDLAGPTAFSVAGELRGTLAYMSPEQLRGDPAGIDLRTDVYSLGVLLYELITGRLPYDLDKVQLLDALQVICEAPPIPLRRRAPALPADQDLETIAATALEKDPARRYQTAAALAEDVRRRLAGDAILARAPSTVYQLGKLVRRHRVPFGLAALALAALAGLAVVSLVQAHRVAHERDRANQEARTARRTAAFLEGLFEYADPEVSLGETVTARDLLDRGAERIAAEMAGEAPTQAHLTSTIARVYGQLGALDRAETLARQAVSLLEPARKGTPEWADASVELAGIVLDRGRADECLATVEPALAASDPARLDRALLVQGRALTVLGRRGEARPVLLRALALAESGGTDVFGPLGALAALDAADDRMADAVARLERKLALQRAAHGDTHPAVAATLTELAAVHSKQARYAEAEAALRAALATRERVYGADHPVVANSLSHLAETVKLTGRYDEALALLDRALAIRERGLGPEHHLVGALYQNRAETLRLAGRYTDARADAERARAIYEKALGPQHPRLGFAWSVIANIAASADDLEAAEAGHRRALAIREAALGPDHRDTLNSRNNLAVVCLRRGQRDEAEQLFRTTLAGQEQRLGPDHPEVALTLNNLANVLTAAKEFDDAEALLRRSLAIREARLGKEHTDVAQTLNSLGNLAAARGRPDEAEGYFRRALAMREKLLGRDHPSVAAVLVNYAKLLKAAGRTAEADAMAKRIEAIQSRSR